MFVCTHICTHTHLEHTTEPNSPAWSQTLVWVTTQKKFDSVKTGQNRIQ